jgi:hypothetical protein
MDTRTPESTPRCLSQKRSNFAIFIQTVLANFYPKLAPCIRQTQILSKLQIRHSQGGGSGRFRDTHYRDPGPLTIPGDPWCLSRQNSANFGLNASCQSRQNGTKMPQSQIDDLDRSSINYYSMSIIQTNITAWGIFFWISLKVLLLIAKGL